jgi:AraC-like DNA-binding protein
MREFMNFNYRLSRPTNHYDENVISIDEQICKLIAERKSVSNNNPGFPPLEQIKLWAEKYGFYENHLHSIFKSFYNEHIFRPKVEQRVFLA